MKSTVPKIIAKNFPEFRFGEIKITSVQGVFSNRLSDFPLDRVEPIVAEGRTTGLGHLKGPKTLRSGYGVPPPGGYPARRRSGGRTVIYVADGNGSNGNF